MPPTYATTWLTSDRRAISRHDLGGHTHHRLDYHFVWRTKFSKKILGAVLSPFLVEQIGAICIAKRIRLLGVAIAADHVHLCVRLRPSQSPSQAMRWIKSTTSTLAFERFPELEGRFGVRHLWARGYHAESLGDKNVFAILAYIGRQDDHHDLGALARQMEEVDRILAGMAVEDEGDDAGDE